MICPSCSTENEIAYSVLSHSLICLEPGCGFELEVSAEEAHLMLEPMEELVCA
jgi:hypothetical protein